MHEYTTSRGVYSAVNVTTTPTPIRPANANRNYLLVTNVSAETVYLGFDENVSITRGFPLPQNASFERDGVNYNGPLYGVVATGSADVRFLET